MIAALVFAAGLVLGGWWMADRRRLPDATNADGQRRVSVIVPARNEAANLPGLLTSLHGCGASIAEVIVVDDDSSDDTAAVAAELGGSVVRLAGGPPPGWAGKPYACATGAAAASAPLLLFLDADVTAAPDAVARLLAAHAAGGGLVSVQPYHRVPRPYEQLSATCNVVAMMGTGAFARWPSRRRPAAFGPCLLTSAADYAAAGGHAAVRAEVVDDVQLAHRYAAAGLPVHVYAGGRSLSFRMYPRGVGQLVEGWSKNLAAGAGLVDPLAVVVGVWWVAACLGFGVLGIDTAARSIIAPETLSSQQAWIAVTGWLAVAVELRWMLRRVGSFHWWTAIVHPVPTVAFVVLFARSAWFTIVRRRVPWRGRLVAVGKDAH